MKKIKAPSKAELENCVQTMTQQQIADKFHASLSTARRWLKRYNISCPKDRDAILPDEDTDSVMIDEDEESADNAVQELIDLDPDPCQQPRPIKGRGLN